MDSSEVTALRTDGSELLPTQPTGWSEAAGGELHVGQVDMLTLFVYASIYLALQCFIA